MNLLSISLRNLRVRVLSSILTTISIAIGTALLSALWLLIAETTHRYTVSLAGYKAIVGPKEGSPLSLVLSTVFNLGAEPGVVPMSVYHELHDGALGRRVGIRYAVDLYDPSRPYIRKMRKLVRILNHKRREFTLRMIGLCGAFVNQIDSCCSDSAMRCISPCRFFLKPSKIKRNYYCQIISQRPTP